MTPLQYLNKELHSAGGRRHLHEPRKADLQKLAREQRIAARKKLLRTAAAVAGGDSADWLADRLQRGRASLESCLRQTRSYIRRHPLMTAAGAIAAGAILGVMLRRR
jgi:ElaB/YqjD/DUF883 family membrane-anchored ribosome-binding protein